MKRDKSVDPLEQLTLCLYWYNRPLSGQEFLLQVKKYLFSLIAQLDESASIQIADSSKKSDTPVASDFSDFDTRVVASLPKQWAYTNADPANKSFSVSCTSKMGFSCSFLIVGAGGVTACILEVSIGKTDARAPNTVILRFLRKQERVAFLIGVFKESVQFWAPTHGSISRGRFDDEVDQPINDIRVGWLTYLQCGAAKEFVPAQMRCESLAGGVLIYLTEVPPLSTDAEAVVLLNQLRAALERPGLLKNPRDVFHSGRMG